MYVCTVVIDSRARILKSLIIILSLLYCLTLVLCLIIIGIRIYFLKADHTDYLMDRVRSGRIEGQNTSALEARLSSSVSDLQQIVADATGHYTCRVYINVNDITANNACGFGCGDSINVSKSCWRLPVDVSTSLLRSSMDEVISFRLALCLCAAVCLISYTAEAEAEAEAKLIMCKQEVPPASAKVQHEVEVEVATKSSQNMGHSRKRKSPLNHNRTPNGLDNVKSGAKESLTSIKGVTLLHVCPNYPYPHEHGGVTRKCRPDFFVQLDPGPYKYYSYSYLYFKIVCSPLI